MALPEWKQIIFSKKGALNALYNAVKTELADITAGIPENGSVTAAKLAADAVEEAKIKNGAVVEGKLGTGAVTAGKLGAGAVTTIKINDEAVTPAKLFDNYIDSAGVTNVALTTAIGDPATLVNGTIYVIKDTTDSNKIKPVYVADSAFLIGTALTAAA
jgi:hypothetical protein